MDLDLTDITIASVIALMTQAAATLRDAAVNEGAQRAISGAWDALTGAFKRRFGKEHMAPAMLDSLKTTSSEAHAKVVEQTLQSIDLADVPGLQEALRQLSAALAQAPTQATTIVHARIDTVSGGVGVLVGNQINNPSR